MSHTAAAAQHGDSGVAYVPFKGDEGGPLRANPPRAKSLGKRPHRAVSAPPDTRCGSLIAPRRGSLEALRAALSAGEAPASEEPDWSPFDIEPLCLDEPELLP